MPYVLSSAINESLPELWNEGFAYKKKNLYQIEEGKIPPVNYDTHILNSHSLTHIESSLHTNKSGKTIGDVYKMSEDYFFGRAIVIRLKGNKYKPIESMSGMFIWKIEKEEIEQELDGIDCKRIRKIIITTDFYPTSSSGYHDPNYVLILTEFAANFLVDELKINYYGTSWKSSDFSPGSLLRPIHNILFKSAIIAECLDLHKVPPGEYFLVSFPLPINDASESPVVPVLFEKNEISNIF